MPYILQPLCSLQQSIINIVITKRMMYSFFTKWFFPTEIYTKIIVHRKTFFTTEFYLTRHIWILNGKISKAGISANGDMHTPLHLTSHIPWLKFLQAPSAQGFPCLKKQSLVNRRGIESMTWVNGSLVWLLFVKHNFKGKG